MRIISSFRDYYDSINSDDAIIYTRETAVHAHIDVGRASLSIEHFILGYCGSIIPFLIQRRYDRQGVVIKQDFCYQRSDFEGVFEEEIHLYFDAHDSHFQHDFSEHSNAFSELECPLFIKQFNHHDWSVLHFESNPSLLDYNFAQIKDPYTAHIEIETFIRDSLA